VRDKRFVIPVVPAANESTFGWLLRICEENAMAPNWLSKIAGLQRAVALTALPEESSTLRRLASMAGATDADLEHRFAVLSHTYRGRYQSIGNVMLPSSAVMLRRAQICPKCLAEGMPLQLEWDLAHNVTCGLHRCWLVDRCPACFADITWKRPRLQHCPECDADWRSTSIDRAPDDVVETCLDIASFAPFRLGTASQSSVFHPEVLFQISLMLALPSSRWFTNDFSSDGFSNQPLAVRQCGTVLLATCREGFLYESERVRARFEAHFQWLAPLFGSPFASRALKSALRFGPVLPQVQNVIRIGEEEDPADSATQRYGNRPPSLRNFHAVASFLGIHVAEVHLFNKMGMLTPPMNGLNCDADEVMECRDFLDSLLPYDKLDSAFGVSGICSALTSAGALTVWPGLPPHPPRVSEASIRSLMLRLRGAATPSLVDANNTTTVERHLFNYPVSEHGVVAASILLDCISGRTTLDSWPASNRFLEMTFVPRTRPKSTRDATPMHPAFQE